MTFETIVVPASTIAGLEALRDAIEQAAQRHAERVERACWAAVGLQAPAQQGRLVLVDGEWPASDITVWAGPGWMTKVVTAGA